MHVSNSLVFTRSMYPISNLATFYCSGSSFKWGPSITLKKLEKQKHFHVKMLRLFTHHEWFLHFLHVHVKIKYFTFHWQPNSWQPFNNYLNPCLLNFLDITKHTFTFLYHEITDDKLWNFSPQSTFYTPWQNVFT